MIIKAAQFLVPGARLTVTGDVTNAKEYAANVDWQDERPQPSWAEIAAAIPVVEAQEGKAIADAVRRNAYAQQSDPIFFKWQRGEATEQEWLDAVAAVRSAYPDPA